MHLIQLNLKRVVIFQLGTNYWSFAELLSN